MTCECGIEFKPKPCQRYCSHACRDKAANKRRWPQRRNNPKYLSQKKAHMLRYMRAFYDRRNLVFDKIKSEPCMDCGKTYPPFCMDFDHRDPSQKVKDISKLVAWRDVVVELRKCDLVCAICHRIREHRRRVASRPA